MKKETNKNKENPPPDRLLTIVNNKTKMTENHKLNHKLNKNNNNNHRIKVVNRNNKHLNKNNLEKKEAILMKNKEVEMKTDQMFDDI